MTSMKHIKHRPAKGLTLQSVWQKITTIRIQEVDNLLFPAFIMVLLAIIVVNTIFALNKQNVQASNTQTITDVQSRPQKVFTSQQTAVSSAYTISISRVTENNTYDPAFTLPDGQTMLLMKISITNNTKGVQNLLPSQQLYVRSIDGDYDPLHASLLATKPLQAATLKPGQTVTGDISFGVLKSQARPLLYVDLGWNNYGPVVFDVLH